MKKDIKTFLKDIGILPVDKKHWYTFCINHAKPIKDERKRIKKMIAGKVCNSNGIYIYKNKFNEVLYVKKGKPLKNRLYMHYLASFKPVPGDTKDKRWHRFWSARKGELKVYWKEVNGEKDRKIIEQMLEYVLAPRFVEFNNE